jgi:hypothetical protein
MVQTTINFSAMLASNGRLSDPTGHQTPVTRRRTGIPIATSHRCARGARHFSLARARSFARLFQFGMLRLVLGFTQVFFVSFAMSCSGWLVRCRH